MAVRGASAAGSVAPSPPSRAMRGRGHAPGHGNPPGPGPGCASPGPEVQDLPAVGLHAEAEGADLLLGDQERAAEPRGPAVLQRPDGLHRVVDQPFGDVREVGAVALPGQPQLLGGGEPARPVVAHLVGGQHQAVAVPPSPPVPSSTSRPAESVTVPGRRSGELVVAASLGVASSVLGAAVGASGSREVIRSMPPTTSATEATSAADCSRTITTIA